MELKQKIINALSDMDLIAPSFNISIDETGNLFGHICSPSFEGEQDEKIQERIWKILQSKLSEDELSKIMMLIHETPKEKLMRMDRNPLMKNKIYADLWVHNCPDLSNYWLFIGTSCLRKTFFTSYFWIEDRSKKQNQLILKYSKNVLDFMELKQQEIIPELYNNALNIATNEIKLDIMHKYEAESKKGRWGGSNIYNYVHSSFEINPATLKGAIFSVETADLLENGLKKLPYSIQKGNILKYIKNIRKIYSSSIKI